MRNRRKLLCLPEGHRRLDMLGTPAGRAFSNVLTREYCGEFRADSHNLRPGEVHHLAVDMRLAEGQPLRVSRQAAIQVSLGSPTKPWVGDENDVCCLRGAWRGNMVSTADDLLP